MLKFHPHVEATLLGHNVSLVIELYWMLCLSSVSLLHSYWELKWNNAFLLCFCRYGVEDPSLSSALISEALTRPNSFEEMDNTTTDAGVKVQNQAKRIWVQREVIGSSDREWVLTLRLLKHLIHSVIYVDRHLVMLDLLSFSKVSIFYHGWSKPLKSIYQCFQLSAFFAEISNFHSPWKSLHLVFQL